MTVFGTVVAAELPSFLDEGLALRLVDPSSGRHHRDVAVAVWTGRARRLGQHDPDRGEAAVESAFHYRPRPMMPILGAARRVTSAPISGMALSCGSGEIAMSSSTQKWPPIDGDGGGTHRPPSCVRTRRAKISAGLAGVRSARLRDIS